MSNEIAKFLEYDGYCQHDCEAYYHCPVCKKQYTSWGFFHQGIKDREEFTCSGCGTRLIYAWHY